MNSESRPPFLPSFVVSQDTASLTSLSGLQEIVRTYREVMDRNDRQLDELFSAEVVSHPTHIALHPDPAIPRAFVTNFWANTISVIDLLIDQVVATIKAGANPVRIVILHGWLHVLSAPPPQMGLPGSVRSISLADPTRVVENSVGARPVDLLVDEKGGWLYVLDQGGEITGILAEEPSKKKVIKAGASGTNFRLRQTKAYVTNFGNDSVTVVDLSADGRVVKVIALGTGAAPFGIAVHPKRPEVFVAKSGHNGVTVIDAEQDVITRPDIKVGAAPLGIGLSPSGCVGLVVNSGDGTISVLDPEEYIVRGQPMMLKGVALVDVEFRSDTLGVVTGRDSQHEIQLAC